MKHLFIINPEAGKGKALGYIEIIHRVFENIKEPYFIEITKYPGHATEIVQKYSLKGEYRVYSIGGDGTLNEVLNGVVGTKSTLAIVPAGSGNDFIKNITSTKDEDLLYRTVTGEEKYIDLGRVNNRYFINISSIGFDSEVTYQSRSFKKIKFISGSFAYILGIIKTLFSFNFIDGEIELDGIKYNKKILLAAIANGKYYGGGIKISPKSDIFDGIFDVCIIDKLSKIKVFLLFPQVIKGRHENIKEVKFYKARKVSIKSSKDFIINVDGEIIKDNSIVLDMIHKGIRVVVP